MITGWRLVKERYAATAFDGEGARQYGGRWNSPGLPLVYLGGTAAIAALEVLAHNARTALLRERFIIIPVRIPTGLVYNLDVSVLPSGWNDPANSTDTARIGDAWLNAGSSAALRVPSAVLPLEWNVLLNPVHPDAGHVQIGDVQHFSFDARLMRGNPQ